MIQAASRRESRIISSTDRGVSWRRCRGPNMVLEGGYRGSEAAASLGAIASG